MTVYREGAEGPYTSDRESRSVPYGSTHRVTRTGGLALLLLGHAIIMDQRGAVQLADNRIFYAAISGRRGCSRPLEVKS